MRFVSVVVLCMVGCEGPAGPAGPPGNDGIDGAQGPAGSNGTNGSDGTAPPAPWLTAPGVRVAVTSLTFDNSGAHVAFKLADPFGVALDRKGLLTDTKVGVSFVLAQLATNPDGSAGQYTAYTTRVQTSPINGNSATQATTEGNESGFTAVDVTQGSYEYTFTAPVTAMDPTRTQTVLAVAVRSTSIDRTTFSARPDGGQAIARGEVTDNACNSCHATLGLHGGRYTSPAQCVLCHQPQSSDPDTGNTVDFKVMIHKIHRGSQLPSVVAGTPYQIIGFQQSVADFSTVEFPQNVARCEACHDTAALQATAWGKASLSPCTSCHDTTSFESRPPAGMVLHGGGALPPGASCALCHPASGSIAGIRDMHYTGLLSATAPHVALAIQSITNTSPGQVPTVTFQATLGGTGMNLTTSPFTSLRATIAGPTSDESSEWASRVQGSSAAGTLTAIDAANGIFAYTFPATQPIPTTATGSYTLGMEGYIQPVAGGPRYAAHNPTLVFGVTDTTPVPRRQIVDVTACNSCHFSLSAHGGSRNDPKYCVMCHNTSLQNNAVALYQGGTALAQTLDFRSMIHKIHAGENLTQGYSIGTSVFSDVRYPRALADCGACHKSQNWTLPMANSPAYAPSQQSLYTCLDPNPNPTLPCTSRSAPVPAPLAPQTSVCTSCHDAPYTLAHAQTNTTLSGVEACATCHGPGMDWDVAKMHGAP